ncbi:hypothetical protein [Staphylococcus nepalensis]|uniref:Uncharacterized protein n=1 Tax=Staphylococcus nepalensis TaxID=214473 RepID=A0A380GPV0_9STAP|nr:hypothetical protein [Staphylococcus nepalensis]VDG67770.1 Uncharacterised protein [Lacrimispora indolis]MBO1222557.1 hypothetical protein [Staphylococcus nepalensis]PNZ96503.1 hypothetical protein CD130_11000 [Staphylococcus nepalensis]SUM55794.1 Uncharacterised protein [Staphylococcus nepalensis]GGB91477.1 hypothetical protein GCM10007203_23230 [Staphylococcus nepalensis]
MNYSEKVEETVEYADLINKVQSVLDFVCSENDELKIERDCAIRNNDPYYYQAINNNMKTNYIISSTLLAIRRDIETMHDDIRADINQEKNALSRSDQTEDNA